MWRRLTIIPAAALALTAGCREQPSEEPPVRLIRHMFDQPRFDMQEPNALFADGRAQRPDVPGTVIAGQPRVDDHLYRGTVAGKPAESLPMAVTPQLLARGQERYHIYCRPCHDGAGTGNGLVAQRGLQPPPTSYHDPRVRAMPVGQLYDVIARGVRTMPSYAAQIPVEDRWAITAYVRALQLSQDAPLDAVPADVRAAHGWTAAAPPPAPAAPAAASAPATQPKDQRP
ncbi:MAG TPA: cytochrome c [Polyangia bacterium]|jgi:mono/diheme cytochrome c family protein